MSAGSRRSFPAAGSAPSRSGSGDLAPKFRFRAAEGAAGGGGRAEGWKGNREASEEGTGEMPSCVGAEPGALGRLKRLTGLLIVNGSKPI